MRQRRDQRCNPPVDPVEEGRLCPTSAAHSWCAWAAKLIAISCSAYNEDQAGLCMHTLTELRTQPDLQHLHALTEEPEREPSRSFCQNAHASSISCYTAGGGGQLSMLKH